mmetsp:Transcript_9878/g.18827  ORF Transcript_9878/g.18827 Transcript_9878/m.18827 type:complete len:219 (-) Transcript_9878:451-1107(-)
MTKVEGEVLLSSWTSNFTWPLVISCAKCIAVCVCNEIGPVLMADLPHARAINTTNWSCRYSSTHPPCARCCASSATAAAAASSTFWSFPHRDEPARMQPDSVVAVTTHPTPCGNLLVSCSLTNRIPCSSASPAPCKAWCAALAIRPANTSGNPHTHTKQLMLTTLPLLRAHTGGIDRVGTVCNSTTPPPLGKKPLCFTCRSKFNPKYLFTVGPNTRVQ